MAPETPDTDTPQGMTAGLCPNGHDKTVVGWTQKNGCRECKREASRRFRARRAAGVPVNESKSQARTDLGHLPKRPTRQQLADFGAYCYAVDPEGFASWWADAQAEAQVAQ